MADILLNKVINEEISSKLFVKWLLKTFPEEDCNFKEISNLNVGQIDFITYFLNFVHEAISCNKSSETPQKLNTPKRIDKVQINNGDDTRQAVKTNLFADPSPLASDQSFSYSTILNNSVDNSSTTPKTAKTPGTKNENYFSPISPLYQNPIQNNLNSKQTRHSNGVRKSGDKHSLCLGDFLVTSSKSSTKKKRHSTDSVDIKKETSRRIKPTSITLKKTNDFQKTENSFDFQGTAKEVPAKCALEQRGFLAKERTRILSCKDSIEQTGHAVVLKGQNSLSKSDIRPILSMVTFKNNINHVVEIYRTILEHKLALNITSEIYFLISLFLTKHIFNRREKLNSLCANGVSSKEDDNLGVDLLEFKGIHLDSIEKEGKSPKTSLCNSEIFESVHNVVYFAVKSLETQVKVIQHYDKTTIRLLAENERIKEFSPAFSEKLLMSADKKAEKPFIETITPTSQTNVCFNIDTDNKEHFPDHISFQAFRKQRDLFYDILRIWEVNHLAPDWNFSLGLGGKIRSLYSFHGSPTNYMHLARLFKNQLLSSCARGPKEKGLSENSIPFLPSLPIDADKLNRLTNRLVTKQASNGINSIPVFSGYQEFFKEFIVVSSNYFFNRHLCDCLISEIIELNDTKFSDPELEEDDSEVDANTRKLFIDCVTNLRILAKFLGFIESLPYRTDVPNLSKNVLDAQIKIREQSCPPIDIKSILESSIEKHTVVLIIPWLTKYLAMLDYVTLRLPYYRSVHTILFNLYQNYNSPGVCSSNAAIVRFCLGWLFELPHFPDVEYFNYCSKGLYYDTSRNGISGSKVKLKEKCLDYMDIVNQSVLYLCCPFLEEIKKLLSTNAPGSRIAVKYITPVSALESNTEVARKKLEQQLEEAFFSGQPTSLRKTIEFVSERIASASVKHICYDLVPRAKESALKDLKEKLLKSAAESDGDENQRKANLKKEASTLAQTHLAKFLETCDGEIQKISNKKITSSIESLLPVDTLEQTRNVCIEFTNKMCTERVKQWINNHVNLTVFTKDFDNELQKAANGRRGDKEKPAFILPPGGRDCSHNETALSAFHALNNIREACCNATESSGITLANVIKLLQDTHTSLTQRKDVNDMIAATISATLFDFCLLLIAVYPPLFHQPESDLLNYFVDIWTLQPKLNTMFKYLFCPKNVRILQLASKTDESWDLYAIVISRLLDRNLIEEDDLESQCTGFYNTDWEEYVLENFSRFLKKLVSCATCDNNTGSKFAYLLDFLSDFCSDL